jgi:hypothetical protein
MTEPEKLSKRRRKTGWRECARLTVRQLPTAAPISSTMTQARPNPAEARWSPYCAAWGGDGPAHRPQLRLRAAGRPVSLTKADFLNRVSHARLHWPSRFDAEVAVTTSAGRGCRLVTTVTDPPGAAAHRDRRSGLHHPGRRPRPGRRRYRAGRRPRPVHPGRGRIAVPFHQAGRSLGVHVMGRLVPGRMPAPASAPSSTPCPSTTLKTNRPHHPQGHHRHRHTRRLLDRRRRNLANRPCD